MDVCFGHCPVKALMCWCLRVRSVTVGAQAGREGDGQNSGSPRLIRSDGLHRPGTARRPCVSGVTPDTNMPHAFDSSGFKELLSDAERLLSGARDHEQRVASLAALLEGESAPMAAGAMPSALRAVGLDDAVGQLRREASEYRQLAETLLLRLIGQRPAMNIATPQRIRLLVVDDSESARDTTATILEEAGFETLTAANGLEGLIVAHYARPTVVLMDVTMPVLDGLEAARLLRASDVTRDVDVIAYTAEPDVRDSVFARWFFDILQKPAAPDGIIAAVQRCVDGRRPRFPILGGR